MKYRMDESAGKKRSAGVKYLMERSPAMSATLRRHAQLSLSKARARINHQSHELSRSGQVRDKGIQPYFGYAHRMTFAVEFTAPYAVKYHRKTEFLFAALGKPRRGGRGGSEV